MAGQSQSQRTLLCTKIEGVKISIISTKIVLRISTPTMATKYLPKLPKSDSTSDSSQNCQLCNREIELGGGWKCSKCAILLCNFCPSRQLRSQNSSVDRVCVSCYELHNTRRLPNILEPDLVLTFSRYAGFTLSQLIRGSPRQRRFVAILAKSSFTNVEYQSKHTPKGSQFRKQVAIAKVLVKKYPVHGRTYNLRKHIKRPQRLE